MKESPISDVSDTALWVAAFRAFESSRPDALFRDPLAAMLVGERGRAIAQAMPYPKILAWMMAVRTVVIDELIQEALALGVDTVVNIGAGLDTRPYRLDLPKDLHWIEIDFPHLVIMKDAKLANEVPRCRLTRHGLDLANRAEALPFYQKIGAQSHSSLIITEGVIAYLSNDEAAQLARDLRSVPAFRFWIQDYKKSQEARKSSKRLQKKLKNAPFRFHHADPLAFFSACGWKVRRDRKAWAESMRLGRPFPLSFPWNFFMKLMSKDRLAQSRDALGFVLFET